MWLFRKMSRAEINQDPTQEDYFNTDHLDNFSDALVREAIQNSLDARLRNSEVPVRVRITFPSQDDLPTASDANRHLENLYHHIHASEAISEPPESEERVTFLVFEDFGTRGLQGDTETADDPAENEQADFYYFWRNIGRGKKGGDERGRWGLGKTMFPASSRIHSFFGLTIRADDSRRLLMGQSVLSIHHIDDQKHAPYGYFGQQDGEDDFVIPLEDTEIIEDFTSTFSISREEEPGLSVVIPFPKKEITSDEVVQSVIEHYFFPVLSGELVVEVVAEGNLVVIDSKSIGQVGSQYLPEGGSVFSGNVKLAKWYLAQNPEGFACAREQRAYRSPVWTQEILSDNQLDNFAEVLDRQEAIVCRVPVHILPKDGEPSLSFFDLILERDPNLEKPLDVFIRSGITISGVHSLRESGVRAMIIAEDKPIVTMLGDAENPAHTEWQERSRNFKGKYKVGPSTLSFVKEAPRRFMRILNRQSEYIDDTALRHVFPGGMAEPNNLPPDQSGGESPDPTKIKRSKIKVVSRPSLFRMLKLTGGLSVGLTEKVREMLPMEIRIEVAYDVRRGNPFRKWVEADFDLRIQKDGIDVTGGQLLGRDGNKLHLRANEETFLLKLTGFDQERDLIANLNREV